MGKIIISICFFVFLIRCSSQEGRNKTNQSQVKVSTQEQTYNDSNKNENFTTFISDTIPKKIKKGKNKNSINNIHGIKRVGNFRLYTKVLGEGEGYYSNLPKIEILNDNDSIINRFNVLDNFTLIEKGLYTAKFNRVLGENYFDINFKQDKTAYNYWDKNLFPKPSSTPSIKLEITYEVMNDVLLCKYSYFSMLGLDVFGGGCEVLLINNRGEEIGRIKEKGVGGSMGISKDHNFFYLTTGGQINEDAFYPTTFTAHDITSGKIVFRKSTTNTESVGGDSNGNRGIMKLFKDEQRDRFDFEIFVFDHIENKIYYSQNPEICKKNKIGLGTKETYCYCTTEDGTRHKFYYDKDFKSKPLISK